MAWDDAHTNIFLMLKTAKILLLAFCKYTLVNNHAEIQFSFVEVLFYFTINSYLSLDSNIMCWATLNTLFSVWDKILQCVSSKVACFSSSWMQQPLFRLSIMRMGHILCCISIIFDRYAESVDSFLV